MFLARLLLTLMPATALGAVQFQASESVIETQQFVEISVRSNPIPGNPFQRFALSGTLYTPGGASLAVDGFCDSVDGSLHRIRFLASQAGKYSYRLRFDNGSETASYQGEFRAQTGKRSGLLRVDPEHPFHFQWDGSGEHYFWNGLTSYALLGWKDDNYIGEIIDRAASYKVNRLRVTLIGPRVADASRWYEPLKPSDKFQFLFGPWPAGDPANIKDPKWDVSRFDTQFFRKAERAVAKAREQDVIISVIFFLDGEDAGADPFGKAKMFGTDARNYYRYVNARLGGFTNVTWDITNEWHLFRNAWWVEQMGTYMRSIDPYHHLISTHGRGDFPWALSQWPDFALYQLWDENGGYNAMLKRRLAQAETGRPLPQVNEEYGYGDTYPAKWGGNRRPPSRNADSRRRLAWEITMAGCYQTGGEKASRNGDGEAPATPGGWINGGFDDSMHMLEGYRRIVDFFTSFPYWRLEPITGNKVARVLAEAGERYVIYLPDGGSDEVTLAAGKYRVRSYNPRTGEWSQVGTAEGGLWRAPESPRGSDVAFLVERMSGS